MSTIIVTRHQPLVEWLIETGHATADTPVLEHATEADVAGRHVIGVLPMRLACHAASITEVDLDLTLEDRQAMASGDLSLERLREIVRGVRRYRVTEDGRDHVHLLGTLLIDLDRCVHGRHQGDKCISCGGPSVGNPHLEPGQRIGTTMTGHAIVVPTDRRHRHLAEAWTQPGVES